jgi:hypothetical protein
MCHLIFYRCVASIKIHGANAISASIAFVLAFGLVACTKEPAAEAPKEGAAKVEVPKILSVADYLNDATARNAMLQRCTELKGDASQDANCKNAHAARRQAAAKEQADRPIGGGSFGKPGKP